LKAGTDLPADARLWQAGIPEGSSVKKVCVFGRAGRGGFRGERGASKLSPLAPKE